jgi:PAS domain-containing protein
MKSRFSISSLKCILSATGSVGNRPSTRFNASSLLDADTISSWKYLAQAPKSARTCPNGHTPSPAAHVSLVPEPANDASTVPFFAPLSIIMDTNSTSAHPMADTSDELARLAEEDRALIENSLDLIALLDPAGRFLRVNEAAYDILGYALGSSSEGTTASCCIPMILRRPGQPKRACARGKIHGKTWRTGGSVKTAL